MNKQLKEEGFAILPQVFSHSQVEKILNCINKYLSETEAVEGLHFFALRHLFQKIPGLKSLIITPEFKKLIQEYADANYFITKAIYFSKPEEQNWFVSYHQDLAINVSDQCTSNEYKNWIKREVGFSVNPNQDILENTLTFRIHLDECDEK